ncbi:hypothetical protein BD413DRAFT_580412 [Trametes elegans]|nr:hypothetical protein BD413DRAFT_580412 [Trametes elegans]
MHAAKAHLLLFLSHHTCSSCVPRRRTLYGYRYPQLATPSERLPTRACMSLSTAVNGRRPGSGERSQSRIGSNHEQDLRPVLNHLQPADCHPSYPSMSSRITRRSRLNREPTAHANNAVLPNPKSS